MILVSLSGPETPSTAVNLTSSQAVGAYVADSSDREDAELALLSGNLDDLQSDLANPQLAWPDTDAVDDTAPPTDSPDGSIR